MHFFLSDHVIFGFDLNHDLKRTTAPKISYFQPSELEYEMIRDEHGSLIMTNKDHLFR